MLEVKNLSISFKTPQGYHRVLENCSFSIKEGETLGIIGESGSGKTVACLAILGLLPASLAKIDSGHIIFNGKDLIKATAEDLRRLRGRKISMIFQDPSSSLNPYLTIGSQLTEALTQEGLSYKKARNQSIEALHDVGIPDPEERFNNYPHTLSGGMRQRVLIAMMLLNRPQLLIADEPTTALDVTIQAQILNLLEEKQRSLKMALILITHDLGIAARLCNQLLLLKAGQSIESGSVESIFYQPKASYTRELLAAIPRI